MAKKKPGASVLGPLWMEMTDSEYVETTKATPEQKTALQTAGFKVNVNPFAWLAQKASIRGILGVAQPNEFLLFEGITDQSLLGIDTCILLQAFGATVSDYYFWIMLSDVQLAELVPTYMPNYETTDELDVTTHLTWAAWSGTTQMYPIDINGDPNQSNYVKSYDIHGSSWLDSSVMSQLNDDGMSLISNADMAKVQQQNAPEGI